MILDGFLIAIICALIVERAFYSKDMNKQVSDCMKALMSRNMNEFVQAQAEEKRPQVKEVPVDAVPLAEATDEQFMKAIKEGLE